MSLVHIFSTYINLNILIVAGFLSLFLYQMINRLIRRSISSESLLKLHYAVLTILFFILIAYPFLPDKKVFMPSAKIWSAQSIKTFNMDYSPSDNEGYLSLPGLKENNSMDAGVIRITGIIFLGSLFMLGIIRISNDLHRLMLIRKESYLIKKYRAVSIYANNRIKVPFSYWLPGQANIVIPTGLLGKDQDYRITLLHEIQHHRNGDTKWVYAIWLIRSLCIINPCIHIWNRFISELQEFACDEALAGRSKIDSQAYARCLLEAAKSALNCKRVPVCATGLTFMVDRQLLKRRIERMYNKLPAPLKWQTSLMVIILIFGLMASIAFASKGVIQDRRITEAQAYEMVEKAKSGSGFPIVMNDLVLKQLNIYLGTPEGREFIKSALKRMEDYQGTIQDKLKQYEAPEEFLAIPLVESGYQNLKQSEKKELGMLGAGLWMFIESTARNYGLKVDDVKDERLDVDLLTDAAMRYLSACRLRFNDWQLALLSYNMGEANVQKAIEKTGSRDAWEIIRAGYENDKDYYPRIMAAIIILKNPDLVN
ncbi:MAG: transglycosylase SLT domain-containing protein [Deltaproteobacteria bacterium]|nr:transglycosylase SLT domain-containing protein [Deltaproteobacteria bacterium]